MDSDRIKEIQLATAYPESHSVHQALLQVWNECAQEAPKESNQTTAIRFLEWYQRKGVIRQFHAYHIPGSDDTIYLNADQLFEIFEKENYGK